MEPIPPRAGMEQLMHGASKTRYSRRAVATTVDVGHAKLAIDFADLFPSFGLGPEANAVEQTLLERLAQATG